jgi:hypothetical protein
MQTSRGTEFYEEHPTVYPTNHRSRPVTILGWLIFLQALGLYSLSGFNFLRINVDGVISPEDFYLNLPLILEGVAFAALAVLATVTAIRIFRLRPSAWVHAVALQGMSLMLAIGLYLQSKPFYVYFIMTYCIFMVLYLNYSDILLALQADQNR